MPLLYSNILSYNQPGRYKILIKSALNSLLYGVFEFDSRIEKLAGIYMFILYYSIWFKNKKVINIFIYDWENRNKNSSDSEKP